MINLILRNFFKLVLFFIKKKNGNINWRSLENEEMIIKNIDIKKKIEIKQKFLIVFLQIISFLKSNKFKKNKKNKRVSKNYYPIN